MRCPLNLSGFYPDNILLLPTLEYDFQGTQGNSRENPGELQYVEKNKKYKRKSVKCFHKKRLILPNKVLKTCIATPLSESFFGTTSPRFKNYK